MNDSQIFLAASGGGSGIPMWSSPMMLKHLDMVRSDVDGNIYQIFNNAPTAVEVTVGPGNYATAKNAWLAGWRRFGDSDKPGDLKILRDAGQSATIIDGVKTYLRGGYIINATPTDYPGLPANAFSNFTSYVSSGTINTPATGYGFAGAVMINSGTYKGWGMVVTAVATGHADAPKTWYTTDGGVNWFPATAIGTTANYSPRLATNGDKRFYRIAFSQTEVYYCDASGAGVESSWTSTGASHGLALSTLSQGALEYVGSTGAKPGTDCLILFDATSIPVAGTNAAVACSTSGGANFSRPTLYGMNANMKAVMVLNNGAGHCLLLAASKTTSPTGVQAWYNPAYGAGTWIDTLQISGYYQVCGGCWDGEKYVVALMASTGVDLFIGMIQGDGSVVFIKVSKSNLTPFITGDGNKNSGNGIHYSRGQYLVRMTSKHTIFSSLGALTDATPTSTVPTNGTNFSNSVTLAQYGESFICFNGMTTIFRSVMTIGFQAPYKPSPDTVECMRVQ